MINGRAEAARSELAEELVERCPECVGDLLRRTERRRMPSALELAEVLRVEPRNPACHLLKRRTLPHARGAHGCPTRAIAASRISSGAASPARPHLVGQLDAGRSEPVATAGLHNGSTVGPVEGELRMHLDRRVSALHLH